LAESNGEDVQVPWFSGLCLEGEVAGQYEIERSGSQLELEEAAKPGLLELDGLAPITIFVGANNSGKSRLMRELFKTKEPLAIQLMSRDFQGLEVRIGEKISDWCSTIKNSSPSDGSSRSLWIPDDARVNFFNSTLKQLNQMIDEARYRGSQARSTKLEKLKNEISSCGITDRIRGLYEAKRCYVPMLRGMRPPLPPELAGQVQLEDKDLYKSRTKRDYFAGHGDLQGKVGFGKQKVFTGLKLYGDLRSRLLAKTQAIRDSVRKYEQFLSSHFFAGQEVILIPVEEGNNDVVHIKIWDNEARPIYDLGDGMQSLIICTYPIVTETEPGSLFFLEEPDLCMHPSLQRTLLEVLKTYHRKMGHQFFITTHSNHLLDLLEDNELVSIFSFSEIADRAPAPADPSQPDSGSNQQSSKPKPSFRFRPSILRDRQTLLELGVRPSATFLANATIWVEGVSDCAYLRAYMEAFVHYLTIRGNDWGKNGINGKSLAQRLEEYKEDRHYAFVEYSGANLTHYSFKKGSRDNGQAEVGPDIVTSVPNLCARAIVIADGDITKASKGDRWKRFAKQLDERFVILPCKEIENLIPEILMRSQVSRDYDHIAVKDLDKIKYAGYRTPKKGVGTYLSSLKPFKTNYAASSGTLNPYRKDAWASSQKGIPWLLRQELKKERPELNEGENNCRVIGVPLSASHSQANEELQANQNLPSYLTQDLIWLCVCLYVHIAKCNHDQETEKKLKEFQQFIRDQGKDSKGPTGDQNDGKQPGVESEMSAEPAISEWPIKDVERNCLLTAFLGRTSKPESIPSPHP
jgi:hypothetical protein